MLGQVTHHSWAMHNLFTDFLTCLLPIINLINSRTDNPRSVSFAVIKVRTESLEWFFREFKSPERCTLDFFLRVKNGRETL